MLVLTRKKGEAIFIGKDIRITVFETDNDKVKIGIEAPKSVSVLRAELMEETISVNLESAQRHTGVLEKLAQMEGGIEKEDK